MTPSIFGRRRRSTTPSVNSENATTGTEITQITRDSKREVPVTFSVFYGKPDLTHQELKHATFADNATIHKEFFESCARAPLTQEGKWGGKGKGRSAVRLYQKAESELPQFQELAYLAARFNDEILGLCGRACAGCGDGAGGVGALVYRPLCCSVAGYEMLKDGKWMRGLMMAVAHLVHDLDTNEKIMKAIGIVERDGEVDKEELNTYVNVLAVPICEPDGECQQLVEKSIDSFIQGILKGLEGDGKRSTSRISSRESISKGALSGRIMRQGESDNNRCDDSEDEQISLKQSNRILSDRHMSLESMQSVRLVVFCGVPIVDPNEIPRPKRLSMFIFTSSWPMDMLIVYGTGTGTSTASQLHYENYQRIAAFHERSILEATDTRCATCPGNPARATTLFHCPISFKHDSSSTSPCSKIIRDIVMRLARFVGGEWKYPETAAALGLDGLCHINDFVVPICQSGSVCEETALVATQVFLHIYLPEGVIPIYPDLYPTTDFAGLWKKEKAGKNPKLEVKMLGMGSMSDAGNKIHDDYYDESDVIADGETKSPPPTPLDDYEDVLNVLIPSKPRTGSWMSPMTIQDFRVAIGNGATWDQLKELCFERTRIVVDFRPPITSKLAIMPTTSPITATTPSSERLSGGLFSSFGPSSPTAASLSSPGLCSRDDDDYLTMKRM
ncbi:hypothetical protein GX48_05229 [Paracoccidioides brasiliensis]|nr:hypothetical protein GX48_05229 [Paracoccidioides brasiliensis]